ncbi:hypothetical protein OROHE_003892 [Orobanche hederae]
MDILPIEMIEEIVSRTSPLDVCGKLSIVSRSFWSAAKSDITWERFLPADLISRRAVSDQYLFNDPWKKIDFDTMRAFPTKKDLYLFLSHNPLIIDDGVMYFWLDKFSGNKCFHIAPKLLSIGKPRGWDWHDSEPSRSKGCDASPHLVSVKERPGKEWTHILGDEALKFCVPNIEGSGQEVKKMDFST